DAWPDDRPVDPVFVAKNVGEMLLVFGQYLRDGSFDPPQPGRTRIWDQTFDAQNSEPGKTVTKSGPWPWICAISPSGQPGNVETGWFRNESALWPSNAPQGSIQYRGDEIAVNCQVIPGTPQTGGKASAICQPALGGQGGFASCTGGPAYSTNAPDGSPLCIR